MSPLRALAVIAALGAAACQAPTPRAEPHGAVAFEAAGPGEVTELVRAANARATAAHRRVLVYVGAPWCEPCVAFHAAATRGELDRALPGLTLLEFDADRDDARLRDAGYDARFVPLFVRPRADGTAGARIEGASKGGDHATELTARLAPLLAP